ncbi:hypothetical protein SKAU_G00204350 [Synaphobranchus kaupii]|uniref:Tenascin-N n=1 Tax=Synaphobranchus kaupii TaxID=118154 RepID=A0A9Q1IY53_SYNKA|nr:hypothetical protein SKAU_G00204350 [Synaphobranchus kaupii]
MIPRPNRRSVLVLLGALCAITRLAAADDPLAPAEKGLTFSHVYKIDMSPSADCKRAGHALPQDQAGELQGAPATVAVDGENDIVFKHNIRLQAPKCDCDDLEALKSLMYRINGLEEEVTYLKTQCSQGCCSQGGGVDTTCSGHGTYRHDTCGCLCDPGWEGPDCSASSCPDECNDNGRCVDGRCVCYDGYGGDDCALLLCPNDCSDKGRCVNGVCVCFDGFGGDDCGLRRCANDCSGNGRCVDGVCICFDGFFSDDCSKVMGPKDLRLVRALEESLLVEWDSVKGAEYYVLAYYPEGNQGASQRVKVPNTQNSYLITGLTPGVTYTVQVYAVIKDVSSEADSLEATTVVTSVDGIRVLGQTEDTILVDWQNPGAELDHFRLTHANPDGQEEEEEIRMSQEARTKHTIIGLNPGTEYLITVQAIRGTYEGKASFVTGITDLDAPTNLVTREVSEDSATVTWDGVQAGIDGYVISYTSADGSSREIPVGADSTSYRLTGLRPGVAYTVYIWAVKDSRASRKTSTEAETELDAPANLVSREVSEDSATVTWDRVQADIDGYVISYTSADGSSREIPVGADSASYRLTGLRPGVVYTVYIWAVKGSRASRKTSAEAETELDAPTNLVTREVSEDSATVTWDKVQADIDGYVISYTSADGSSREIPVGADSASYRLTGLRPGVAYTVYIWAVKGSRTSRKTSTEAETDLDAPTNLVSREVSEDSATVTWDWVQADIDGYVISYTSADGSSREIPVGADSASYRLTGLRPGVVYTVYIWAVKGSRTSRKTSTEAETDLDAPTNLVSREVSEDSATVTWDMVQADIDGYVISYTSANGSSREIPVGADSASYRLTGLRPGVVYTVYIWAVKGSRTSRKASTEAETDLDAPTNLVSREVSEDSATVTWDRVQADIDGYVISYTSADGSSQGEIPVGADSATYRLTGLRPGVVYTVYIWAVKGSRASRKASTEAETEIDAPSNLKASGIRMDGATVTWKAPLAAIDGYILTYTAEDGSGQAIERRLQAREKKFGLVELETGKRYIVTLLAYRGAKRSRLVQTTFSTVGLAYPFPMDCTQIMKNGNSDSGVYTIYINNDRSKPIQVYCDMTTDGGGWAVLQRRTTGKLDFMKRWRQYVQGFGNLTDEFWLGLEKMYELTNTATQYELRVDLKEGGESAYAVYDNFKLAPSRQKYKLTIGNYRGNAGDAMSYHQGRPFSTIDSDNDIALGNCALTHRGAWWYKNCHLANLNGKWGDSRHSMGVNWEPWKGHLVPLDFTEMKLRPVGASGSVLGRKRRSLEEKRRTVQAK